MAKKVLIAEDQPDSRQLLEDLMFRFHPYGVRVFTARDGIEAFEIAAREMPDLILLDILMPGMSGYEICREVRANPETAHAYVMMVTALTNTEDRREALRAGADDFVSKPFDIGDMLRRIAAALGVSAE